MFIGKKLSKPLLDLNCCMLTIDSNKFPMEI